MSGNLLGITSSQMTSRFCVFRREANSASLTESSPSASNRTPNSRICIYSARGQTGMGLRNQLTQSLHVSVYLTSNRSWTSSNELKKAGFTPVATPLFILLAAGNRASPSSETSGIGKARHVNKPFLYQDSRRLTSSAWTRVDAMQQWSYVVPFSLTRSLNTNPDHTSLFFGLLTLNIHHGMWQVHWAHTRTWGTRSRSSLMCVTLQMTCLSRSSDVTSDFKSSRGTKGRMGHRTGSRCPVHGLNFSPFLFFLSFFLFFTTFLRTGNESQPI